VFLYPKNNTKIVTTNNITINQLYTIKLELAIRARVAKGSSTSEVENS
jgi:hypothetical protein